MIANHAQFLDAIRARRLIRISFYSTPDGDTVDRECAPLDYGPELGAEDPRNRYWIWDFAGTAGANPLALLPAQITRVQVLGTEFDPAQVQGGGRAWFVLRDWGSSPAATGPSPAGS